MTPTEPNPRPQPDQPSPAPAPRTRGAQPGNNNALKHGLYSRTWRQREQQDLQSLPPLDLEEEIAMLRIYIRRMIEADQNSGDILATRTVLRTLILACHSITRLLKAQRYLHREEGAELQQALHTALQHLEEPPSPLEE